MSDIKLEQTPSKNQSSAESAEPGFLHIAETSAPSTSSPVPPTEAKRIVPITSQTLEHPGTVEHLAARRQASELDENEPEVKQRLSELRAEVTKLLTALRWEGLSVEETAQRLIPLLNVGSVQQWKALLIPYLLEIDRAGNLLPVWLKIIEREDPKDLSPDANPADTMDGRARRFALLMLGNYKSVVSSDQEKPLGFSKQTINTNTTKTVDLPKILAKAALDPNTSLYATQSLVKQGTTAALQALMSTLKQAEGWAKVDIVEACLTLKQEHFYDLVIADGLDRVQGLESYVAIPIYRTISLENYLGIKPNVAPQLAQQAALIFSQILQDSTIPPGPEVKTLPILFERPLPVLANTLFAEARRNPTWQYTIAIHRLGVLLGHYWNAISSGALQDTRITEPVYACLPLMPDIERWMSGPGRDVLLTAVAESDGKVLLSIARVLGELREPRVISLFIARIEGTRELTSHEQARILSTFCDALGRLGDRRAVTPMLQLLNRTIDIEKRAALPKRRDHLPAKDSGVYGSLVYGSVIRACGILADQSAYDSVLRATDDYDPYIRLQALEALKRIDPSGNDIRSRTTAREALNDPRDAVVRTACHLVLQYRDSEAVPSLQHIVKARLDVAPAAYDVLRQLGG